MSISVEDTPLFSFRHVGVDYGCESDNVSRSNALAIHVQKKQNVNGKKNILTYSSWDSQVVTYPSTNQPVNCLNLAERTGCLVLSCLWPYVTICEPVLYDMLKSTQLRSVMVFSFAT